MFETYLLNDEGLGRVGEFKSIMAEAVEKVKALMPDSKAKTVFFNKIEEGVFYGAKAIASKPENFTRAVIYPGNTVRFSPSEQGIKLAMESKTSQAGPTLKPFAFKHTVTGEVIYRHRPFGANAVYKRDPDSDLVKL